MSIDTSEIETSPKISFLKGSPIFGVVFILVGLGCLYLFARWDVINCQRKVDLPLTCTIHSSILGFIPLEDRLVSNPISALLGQSCGSEGCTFRVEFVTPSGNVPVSTAYSSDTNSKQDLIYQINTFLQNPQSRQLQVSEGLNLFSILIPLVFIAAGIYAVFVPIRNGRR